MTPHESPVWLKAAHAKLDAAVFATYGWPPDLSDDELLARLLALNLSPAAPSTQVAEANAGDEE